MVKQIKLTHNEEFSCEYVVNDRLVSTSVDSKEHVFSVQELPCKIKINLNPYKVKPIVRIDNIMVNYGLAKITPWDHMLEFDLDLNFFDHYFTNIIESKRQYLDIGKEEIQKKIGLEDLSKLVDEIEGKIV